MEPKSRILERSAAFLSSKEYQKSINYLISLVYGYVIPTYRAGNIEHHSVVKKNTLPGSQVLTCVK